MEGCVGGVVCGGVCRRGCLWRGVKEGLFVEGCIGGLVVDPLPPLGLVVLLLPLTLPWPAV